MSVIHGAPQEHELTLDRFLVHAARWHGGKQVVTARADGSVHAVGYRDLCDRARRVSALLADLGVARGECVATLAWNSQAHMEAWYGIMGMGAVCHTLNPRLPANTLRWMLEQSRARVLIASADLSELVRETLAEATQVETVLIVDGSVADPVFGDGSASMLEDEIASRSADIEWGNFSERLPSGLCFTSGTTGAPKGVTYTHRANYLHTLRQLQADVTGLVETDVVLPVVPMFHANAWGLPFACPAVGASLVLPGPNADGASLARLIAAQEVTIAVGVPTVWLNLMDHLDRTGSELPSLERIMVGGAPMPSALARRIAQRGIAVQPTWGMTELSPLGTSVPPGRTRPDLRHSGRVSIGVDVRLTDHEGVPLPEQREGEGRLWARGEAVVERYFGCEQPATRDGWFDTGDLAMLDADGNLSITGRAKELIKSGGEWINPAEIETAMAALPQVTQAAVIARQDARWGERPVLVVTLKEGDQSSDEALLAPLRTRFAKWWVPDAVIRLDQMPLAATGKVDKRQLQARYGAQ